MTFRAGRLNPVMINVVSEFKVPYIIMHMRGTPKTMQSKTKYEDIVPEICNYFKNKIEELHSKGIHDIVIDPGIGFAKTVEQNFQIIQELESFQLLGAPTSSVLVVSRLFRRH